MPAGSSDLGRRARIRRRRRVGMKRTLAPLRRRSRKRDTERRVSPHACSSRAERPARGCAGCFGRDPSYDVSTTERGRCAYTRRRDSAMHGTRQRRRRCCLPTDAGAWREPIARWQTPAPRPEQTPSGPWLRRSHSAESGRTAPAFRARESAAGRDEMLLGAARRSPESHVTSAHASSLQSRSDGSAGGASESRLFRSRQKRGALAGRGSTRRQAIELPTLGCGGCSPTPPERGGEAAFGRRRLWPTATVGRCDRPPPFRGCRSRSRAFRRSTPLR